MFHNICSPHKERERPMIYAVYYHKEKHSALRRVLLILLLIYSHVKHNVLHSYSTQRL